MLTYQNYHRHSTYTNPRVSDSIVTNEAYALRAVELGHGIISTMEHGHQGRYIEGYELAKKHNLKFVFGTEAYWVKDRFEKDRTNCHIYLGARNENGRQAINDILSEANLTGFYGQARLDCELLMSLPPKDVIITTACVAGWKYDFAEQFYVDMYKRYNENFFLEVQYHNTDSQRDLNRRILRLHDREHIPIIMGCDSHFILGSDAQDRTDFLESKQMFYDDEIGWYLDYPDGETAYNRFVEQCALNHSEIMDAMNNTNVFLEVEEYDCPCFNSEIKMPSLYPDWTQEQKDAEYERLVWHGWNEYKSSIPAEKHELYRKEIQDEIDTVKQCFMSDYFILNYHVIKQGKQNGGWLTHSGRGSAVSFITNMLLGFSEVDRVSADVHMYPSRFMSAERILQSGSCPDIDFNVADQEPFAKAQQQVLGEDHAYPMIAYGTMKSSAAWKLYAKAKGVEFSIANEVSEQIKKYENALKNAKETDEDADVDPFEFIDESYRDVYEKSKDYQGVVTSWSIAPCSYLLYPGSIRKEIGLVRVKDHICCMMDGHWAEAGHFLKNDLLTVKVLELINRTFERIEVEPFTATELLSICTPNDPCWQIYEKGITQGINQVEQDNAAVRVARYKPKNISELCAFVAAIRPGFKSMYKTFEARDPFSYGVKPFDDLIQTEHMPNSFMLYQEMAMAALNFAGIPMADCYTAIKNIAKKRVDKVLGYKETFISGFSKTLIEEENEPEDKAIELSEMVWQVIADSSNYSFNASHAYCVAVDSLYGAWLKAHHPLEFYETYMRIMEEKGDKDKIQKAKEEAEDYFKIKFPPFRFGQDNRQFVLDHKTNSIMNNLSSIKGFGNAVGEALYECSLEGLSSFIDILKWLDERGIKAAKVLPLIKIDYFQQFGNIIELMRILEFFDLLKQGKAKQIAKDKIPSQVLRDIISAHSIGTNKNGTESKSFTIQDMDTILHEAESAILSIGIRDFDYKNKAEFQQEILGYVDLTTGREEDRRKLFITDVRPLGQGTIWGYSVFTKSVGSGKGSRLTVKSPQYIKQPIHKGDIVYADEVWKNDGGYWYLKKYHHLL